MNPEASGIIILQKSENESNVSDTCHFSFEDDSLQNTPNPRRRRYDNGTTLQEYSTATRRNSTSVRKTPNKFSQVFQNEHFHDLNGCSSGREMETFTDHGTMINKQPQLESYQLVGDSLLLRFAEQILQQEAKIVDGARCIGLCVSGQKMKDLLQKVEQELYPVGNKIVLLIGTNDILQKTEESQMRLLMKSLLKELCKRATQIVLLTLPPIPKLEQKPDWERIEVFNTFIKSLEDDNIRVADINKLYMGEKDCKMEFFEKYYRDGERPDLIHLNKLGLTEIKTFLLDNDYLT